MLDQEWLIPIIGHPSSGKSTLIRILTGKRVSIGKKGGTTKKINIIPITYNLSIIDFPGYGKVSKRSKKFADNLQQKVVDYLEDIKPKILVGIVVSDLFNIDLISKKIQNKGFIPIDYELTEFIAELSQRKPIVLGNKIDKLDQNEDVDKYTKYFPPDVDFFPVSLKHKIDLEPFLIYLQMISEDVIGDEISNIFWRP